MTWGWGDGSNSGGKAGHWLRYFLDAVMLLSLLAGLSSTRAAHAVECPSPPDMSLPRLQGTVYGPSGVPVPQIMIRVEREGKVVAQSQTDDHGKFAFKVAPGNVNVHVQFLGSKSVDMKVRVGHSHGGLFHTARLRVVLGISGTRCSFATTSSKQFKDEIRHYQQHLVEAPPGP